MRTAWRWWPIARSRAATPRTTQVLARIGAAHKKTAAQISLRYLVQQNIVVIPRTSKVERLTENTALFDFTLERRRDGRDRRAGAAATAASSIGPIPAAPSGISVRALTGWRALLTPSHNALPPIPPPEAPAGGMTEHSEAGQVAAALPIRHPEFPVRLKKTRENYFAEVSARLAHSQRHTVRSAPA